MAEQTKRQTPYRRFLFCTDFSENADYAFTYALDAALHRPNADLYLLHVIPEPDAQFWKTYLYEVDGIDEKARQDIDEKIAKRYCARMPEGMDLKIEICVGKDYIKILEFAREKDIDLIIIGRQGRGGLGKVLFGQVTEKVTRKAECAVLVVPMSMKQHMATHPEDEV